MTKREARTAHSRGDNLGRGPCGPDRNVYFVVETEKDTRYKLMECQKIRPGFSAFDLKDNLVRDKKEQEFPAKLTHTRTDTLP